MKETLSKLLPLGAPDACIEAVGMHYTKSTLQSVELAVRAGLNFHYRVKRFLQKPELRVYHSDITPHTRVMHMSACTGTSRLH